MNILAIGAGGFIGSFTVEELAAQGHEVTVLDFKPVEQDRDDGVHRLQGNVTNSEDLRKAMEASRPQVVINLAALLTGLCAKEPFQATLVNIMGTANVLELARLQGVQRVVLASSAGVCTPERKDTREECSISPEVSMYGATKFMGEVLNKEFRHNYGLEVVSLRYTLIYGTGEVASPGNALRLKMIENAVTGQDVVIDDVRETDRVHLLHVRDAARATVLAATVPGPLRRVYNISGVPEDFLSFGEIVQILKRINPDAGKVEFHGQGAPMEHGLYLCDKARKDLGYQPSFTAEEGFRYNAQTRMEAQGGA
eukprot:TRINITY_DN53297_c0_g1_i1.p2 TRINITY_DN53297_c0_g1~~TRINITY_DN53297_c0_g1_i1.p2  ORF type:complete len:311 (+),score=101.20 TRINITY_DN53297_c0_g1_i1:189-1121(+)